MTDPERIQQSIKFAEAQHRVMDEADQARANDEPRATKWHVWLRAAGRTVHVLADRDDPALPAACGACGSQSPLRALRGALVTCPACLAVMRRQSAELARGSDA